MLKIYSNFEYVENLLSFKFKRCRIWIRTSSHL